MPKEVQLGSVNTDAGNVLRPTARHGKYQITHLGLRNPGSLCFV